MRTLTWGRYIHGPVIVSGHRAKPTGMPDGCSPLSFGLLRFGIRLRRPVSLFLLVSGKLVLAFELQLEFDLLEFRSQFFILGDRFAQSFSLCVERAVEIVLCLVILVGQK